MSIKVYVESDPMHRLQWADAPDDFLVWRHGSGGTVEILDIQVSSDRRKGRGRALVERLLRDVCAISHSGDTRVWAITRSSNLIAQKFYEALGFDGIPLRRFYSSEKNVDAVLYIRSAGGSV